MCVKAIDMEATGKAEAAERMAIAATAARDDGDK